MLSELLLASAIQIGPFWQHDEQGSAALRPLWSTTAETTDVLWPVFTAHRDWWRCCFVPFFHWRDDGSWGFWPVYGVGHQRESDHRYFLWPIFTWADYRADRDTSGAGFSWMFWPLVAHVERERESQWMAIPPLFSCAIVRYPEFSTPEEEVRGFLLRCPWPIFEWENSANRERISILPLYERVRWRSMKDGEFSGSVTRFGWRLVEIYDDETRVFPIWTSRSDGSYFRLWPFWESSVRDGVEYGRFLSLFPIRHVPAVDRNWSKFWTFYEREENPVEVNHSLFWGIIRWRTSKP